AQAGQQPLPFELAARMLAGACEGLAYAHSFAERGKPLNIIHRDISPENLLVGTNGVVKVADFGIARVAGQQRMTRTGTVRGKLVYMAPEQMLGEPVDCRVDVFALGIVLYELICGRRPFEAKSETDAMKAILTGTMIPASNWRPDMPPELQAIIDKAMARSSSARYRDCTELQMALERFIALRGVMANSQLIGKFVAKYAQPVQLPAAPAPAVTVVIPPREAKTAISSQRTALTPRPGPIAVAPFPRRRPGLVVGSGIALALLAVGSAALWQRRPEPLVLPPPAPVAVPVIEAQPVVPAPSAAVGEEEYPIPPPPPAAPKPTLINRVTRMLKPKGAEPKHPVAAKLTDDEVPAEPVKPALKGRLTLSSKGEPLLHNDTSFAWHDCDVRLPFGKMFRLAGGRTLPAGASDHAQRIEEDLRKPDTYIDQGWAVVRCSEGASYVWWGTQRQ
ncbi:MAG: serine/threonine protein kinase, partial [Myxococcaceae bacterium]|nr:serine/threonine protein kinase [Myxococcaceae bacterium]